jgi:hypothetical protein
VDGGAGSQERIGDEFAEEVVMIRSRACTRAFALLLLSSLAACAFVEREAELRYSAPARDAAAAAGEGAVRATVAVRDIVDRRKDVENVGNVRNGFGMKTADVHGKGDPVAWVREATRQELQRAGFVPQDATAASDLVVDVQLHTTYCTAYLTYEGDVSIAAKAMRHDRAIVDGVYVGKGSAGMNWTATDASFGETLDLALQDALIQFLRDVRKAEGTAVPARGP